jgi:hypothetical protein
MIACIGFAVHFFIRGAMRFTKRSGYRLSAAFLLVSWMVIPMAAQNITGEIDGTVTDSSGASIRTAQVRVTNTDTKEVVRTLTTNQHGDYTASSLAPGTYSVMASSAGFVSSTATGIAVTVSDTLTVNLRLNPGDSETVTVVASPLAPNLETNENSSIISNAEVKELALNTRNFEQLLILEPGASYGGPDELTPGMISPSGAANNHQISINGLRPSQLTWLLDGADMLNHSGLQQVAMFPSIDSIAEAKIIRNGYGAQYGGGGSAQVLLVTKAGGASYHGDAYYFWRSQYLNATPFFNLLSNPPQPKPPIKYNDFGYSVGGPLHSR